jgi:hypothetical protein
MAGARCVNDALVELLNSKGYHPVYLPLSGLKPPEVYTYVDGNLIRRGPLRDYLPLRAKMPPTTSGTLSKISHKQTSRKNWTAAAGFLKDALECIGITSAPKLDLSFAGGKELTFLFTDATYQAVDPSKIDQLLTNEELNTGAIPAKDIAAGNLHIIYDYAYATELKMQTSEDQAFQFDVTGAKIDGFIDLGTKGKAKGESKTTVSFKGASGQPAAFAFKAGQLKREAGKWEFYPGETLGQAFVGDEGDGIPYLMERGVVLRLSSGHP